MKLSRVVARKVKMYFDLGCPATWASLKVIKEVYNHYDIDYVPICDWKVELRKNLDKFEEKRAAGEISKNEKPSALIKNQPKSVPEVLQSRLRPNWQEIYAESLPKNGVISMIFLTALKLDFPQFFHLGIDKIGTRLWEEGQPVHKGCFMSTCAREISIPFRDSEYIVSRLSHRLYRHQLSEWSNEAVSLGGQKSPFFTVTDHSAPLCFEDVFQLEKVQNGGKFEQNC